MTALTQARDTKRREGHLMTPPAATATTVYAGGIACINAGGYCTKGAVAATLKSIGVFDEDAANPGANGALTFKVRRDGWFRFANSAAGDAIALADVGAAAYVVDDQTVAKTDGAGARSKAGTIRDVDAEGVWIEFV